MRRLAIFFALLSLTTGAAAQRTPAKPPPAPVHSVTTTYFGVDVADPYRNMEKLDDPAVKAWIGEQNEYARATLDSIPGRAKLLAELNSIESSEPARLGRLVALPGDRYLYLKEGRDQNSYDLYRRDGLSGKEVLLVDAQAARFGGGPDSTIPFFSSSFDDSYILYAISSAGAGKTTIRVLNTQNGQVLPDAIDGVEAPAVAWLPDGHSFLYVRSGEPGTGAAQGNGRVYLHRLGTDPSGDVAVFGASATTKSNTPGGAVVSVETAPGSSEVVVGVQQGASNSLILYATPLAQIGKATARWTRIGNDNVTILDYRLRGDEVFLLVNGMNGPVIARVPLREPAMSNWGMMIQLSSVQSVTGMEAAADAVYLTVLDARRVSLIRVPYASSSDIVQAPLPFDGNVKLYEEDPRVNGAMAMLSSWTRAPAVYRYNGKGDVVLRTDLWPSGPNSNPRNLVSTNATALGSDGTFLPLTIVFEKGLQRDGTHPTLLMEYGPNSSFRFPTFNPIWRVWFDRGGVLAFVRVSGAGPYNGMGQGSGSQVDWSGSIQNFLTCAQYLISQGYTTADRLAATGVGGGAVVVGRAVTTNPKLFRAVVIESGILDPLRFDGTAAGMTDAPEYGNAKTLTGFRNLESLSPYEHVEPRVPYPAVLLDTETGDGQVPAWQSAKMAARLQANSTSGLPILLNVRTGKDHALAGAARQNLDLFADEIGFLLWQVGETNFQPAQPATDTASK